MSDTRGANAAPSAALGVAAMVGATLLWGGTFVVLRDALHRLSPLPVVFARFAIAGAIFAGLCAATGRRPSRRALGAGVFSGILVGALYALQSIGLTRITAGSSAFLTCAGSLFTGLLAWPLLGQRPNTALNAGMLLALAGSALLSLDARLAPGFGETITFAGAVSYSLGLIVVGRLGADFDPLALAATQSLTTAVCLAPWAPRALTEIGAAPPGVLARLVYLVVAGTLVAPWLQLTAQRALPPGRIGLLLALEPVFALVLAVTFGGERFATRWWIGAALILCATLLVEWPRGRERSGPP